MVGDAGEGVKLSVQQLSVWFGQTLVVKAVTLEVRVREILAIIGPANSGKTSFLRALNRLNDLNPLARMAGTVQLDGQDLYRDLNGEEVRRRVGMVFALPVPLPMTVFDNVAFGPRRHGTARGADLQRVVEASLRAAFLWDEVKDRLAAPAATLSGGQQQRLCMARTLAVQPEVILFDEPCSGLDPVSTGKVEDAMYELRRQYTLVLVTNNTKQAARVGDRTAFFLMGELVEADRTDRVFTAPRDRRTEDYISGRFG